MQNRTGDSRDEMFGSKNYQSTSRERSKTMLADHVLQIGVKKKTDRESADSLQKP